MASKRGSDCKPYEPSSFIAIKFLAAEDPKLSDIRQKLAELTAREVTQHATKRTTWHLNANYVGLIRTNPDVLRFVRQPLRLATLFFTHEQAYICWIKPLHAAWFQLSPTLLTLGGRENWRSTASLRIGD